MNDIDIIIVGAGASGLMAARDLTRAGKRVVVLEARDRLGGRIHSLSQETWGFEAQGGAEFVHGDAPVTHALVAEAGLTMQEITEWWNVRDGKPTKQFPRSPHQAALIEALRTLSEDTSVAAFLEAHFIGDEFGDVREQVRRRTEGYEAADANKASAFALRDDLTSESSWKQTRLHEGYGALVRFLGNGIDVRFKKEVSAVEAQSDSVSVTTREGTVYAARYAVISVPLPILSQISFTPDAPEKMRAIEGMGYGAVIKILLRFSTRWWTAGPHQTQFEKVFFMFSNEEIPTWWTQYPEKHPVLVGWRAGPAALRLARKSEAELIDTGLISLSNIFSVRPEELRSMLVASYVGNWPNDPLALGGYSYHAVGREEMRRTIVEPIGDAVFFCGEALDEKEYGTVEAALASGKAAARRILEL